MTVVNKRTDTQPKVKKSLTTKEHFLRERMFGQIVLKANKITPHKLKDVLLYQAELRKQGVERKIGEILVEAKCIEQHEIADILKKQRAMDIIRKRQFEPVKKIHGKQSKNLNNLIRNYKKGEIIFKENDESGHDLFVIQSGEIGVYKKSIHLGKRFERGAFLGTTSCLLKTPRIATAVAMKDSVLLKIPEKDVQSFFAKNPQMALKLSSVLAQRVSQITRKYVDLVNERPGSEKKLHDPLLIDSAESDSICEDEKSDCVFNEPLVGDNQVLADNSRIDAVQRELSRKKVKVGGGEMLPEAIAFIEVGEQSTADYPAGVNGARADENFNEPEDVAGKAGIDGDAKYEETAVSAEKGLEVQDNGIIEGELRHEPLEDYAANDAGESGLSDSAAAESDGSLVYAPLYKKIEAERDENDMPIPVDPLEAVKIKKNREIEIPQGSLKDIIARESPLSFSEKVRDVLDCRLDMYVKLEDLAKRRDALEAKSNTTDRAKNELSSLRRELSKIPAYEPLKQKRDKLAEVVTEAEAPSSAEAEAKPALGRDVIEAYRISVEQKSMLLDWYDTMEEVINICSRSAAGQLMYKVMLKTGVNPSEVFGWAVYVLALNEYLEELKEKQKDLRNSLKSIEDEQDTKGGGGILGLFKKKPEIDEEILQAKEKEKTELEEQELLCRVKSGGIIKELAAVEPVMVNAFWAVYGALGLALVEGVEKSCEPYVRGYLRWGILGLSADFIRPEILEPLLEECAEGAKKIKFGMESDYILYADEVIELTAQKILLPNPNEDLEMNERNSPRWKVDRAHRKIVAGEFYIAILQDLQVILQGIVDENVAKKEEKEKELEAVPEDDPERKKKVKALKKAVQNYKINAVKTEKLVEKARDEMAGKIQADIDSGRESMEELGMEAEPEELARHEIACIRRFSRLVAKLQEPFLPFTLRDKFDPEMKTTNTRKDMEMILKDIETKDPLIFKENMLSSMKKNNRVQIRTSPFIHLLPASGIMGFVMSPRIDTYSGKIMLPGYFERSGMREDIAVESFSDFRYDTSKEQAGNDVMNSDTLVAAYAEVRWILRKKDKDVRQKAGIFTDENERTNWRRHYAMYINSAYDGGKQLFFKCPDLYELVINKFIELPEGIQVLSRG